MTDSAMNNSRYRYREQRTGECGNRRNGLVIRKKLWMHANKNAAFDDGTKDAVSDGKFC